MFGYGLPKEWDIEDGPKKVRRTYKKVQRSINKNPEKINDKNERVFPDWKAFYDY